METVDKVDHPSHYTTGTIEVIDFIEDQQALRESFSLGNCVKYICRSLHKDNQLEDLHKARWYLDREIRRLINRGK